MGLAFFIVVTLMYPLDVIWSSLIVKLAELSKKWAVVLSPDYSPAKLAFHIVLMYLAFQLSEWSFIIFVHG